MEEYSNSAARVSFQVILYEGSNSIEIQYKKLTGFTTTRNVTAGIENLGGTDGIEYTKQRPVRFHSVARLYRDYFHAACGRGCS